MSLTLIKGLKDWGGFSQIAELPECENEISAALHAKMTHFIRSVQRSAAEQQSRKSFNPLIRVKKCLTSSVR
ncbi:MAG: hypothetical protein BWK80_40970 [Desulfobacteraceae bacterium IS3]|nr:MAG: hypothetical protein BWK80_40970 [Desulfobacteraceae bacterium IS3]